MYEIICWAGGLVLDHYGNKEYETYDDAYDACIKFAIEGVKSLNKEKYHNRYLARYYEGGCFEVILDHKIKRKGRNYTFDAAVVYYKTRDIDCRDENDLDPEIMEIYVVSPCDNSDISRKRRYRKDKNRRMTAKERRDKCIENILLFCPIAMVLIFLLLCFLGKIFNWG